MKSNTQLQLDVCAAGGYPNRSVLIVEDDFDQLEILTRWFVRSGYQVHGYYDPLHALEAASLRPFQVAIIDAHLPEMSGLELMRHLKLLQDGMQVVILSSERFLQWRAKSEGAFACLVTPCNMEKLDAMVEQALEQALEESTEKSGSSIVVEMSVAT